MVLDPCIPRTSENLTLQTTRHNASYIHCSVTPPPDPPHDGNGVHTCKHTHIHTYIHIVHKLT